MVADYRYYFGSLLVEGVIAEIPCYGTYMDMTLNQGGTFQGSFQLDQTGKENSDLLSATVPGFSYVVCERNGDVIWGGVVWSRTYQSESKDVQLFGQSFDRYPYSQVVDVDYTSVIDDQVNVFYDVWNNMQANPTRNLSITIPPLTAPLVNEAGLVVAATDMRTYGDLLDELANTDIGFDWYVSVSRVGRSYLKQLVVGYPTVGTPASSTSLVFEYPGSITNYYYTESMAEACTTVFVSGSGDGSGQLVGRADSILTSEGWPRWDFVAAHKDIQTQFTADIFAQAELRARLAPKPTIKITVKGDGTPEFGAWGMGDSVRVVCNDPRFPDTQALNMSARIAKWTLNPPTAEQVEEYGLVMVGDDSV